MIATYSNVCPPKPMPLVDEANGTVVTAVPMRCKLSGFKVFE